LSEIFQRLVVRNAGRTEAEIQADVRQFILSAPFELADDDLLDVILESPVGDRRRIDVEAGSTVIEVKRDLRKEKAKREAEEQLAGYVDYRMTQTGLRYVGVLTDGTEWNCYDLVDGHLRLVSHVTLQDNPIDRNRLVVWLEGVLATTHGIPPTIKNIEERLGAESSAYKLDRATLANLYNHHHNNPTVQVKRKLWSQLLLSALGTQFSDDDELFIDHTLLVNTAEIIAHAVLGLNVKSLPPATLLAGKKFAEAGVFGVVESDFFDWVVEVEGGEAFIRTLAKRLMRFVWGDVNQDILKILYENFIGTETRKKLGEYYTPDWLAEVIVSETIKDPLKTRVLDPSCGSGTFLFHAVRRYITAGEADGHGIAKLLTGVTRHVVGMDLHPVAVTLARVTYILAIGRDKLTNPKRGDIQIPVYLGDSFQWREQNSDLFSHGNLVIRTEEQQTLLPSELTFPDALLDDAGKFDQLVNGLADASASRKSTSPLPSLRSLFSRLEIPKEFQSTIDKTFKVMCRLHDEGLDHIWGYYIRNLARPVWLSRPGNQVDMIVGNPPWLAYSHMTPEMQDRFRAMSERRDMWAGAQMAPHQDLSGLFVVRACELYLRKGGHFAMVLPNAAVDREHYAGFRSGRYVDELGILTLKFSQSWDLRRIRPHFFPRAACVVFGARTDEEKRKRSEEETPVSGRMPDDVEIWTGQMETANAPWSSARTWVTRSPGKVRHSGLLSRSPYAPDFTQGAILAPQVAFIVKKQESSPLGVSRGRIAVESQRSPYEKKPWKDLPPLSGVVESQFVRPCFSGEKLYPFRMGHSKLSIIPDNGSGLLGQEGIDLHLGLQQWWAQATNMWETHRSSERLSLTEQLDFQSKLSKQLPIAKLRIVYNTSGMHICSAKLRDDEAILNSDLYWAPMQSEREADFISAILNAPVTTELARPFMSYGKDERHIHKHVWELPIPKFDANDAVHVRIADIGGQLEKVVATFEIDESVHFSATRRHIRSFIMETSEGQELNDIVTELIG
jgi:SAM-dependent methyltransferase